MKNSSIAKEKENERFRKFVAERERKIPNIWNMLGETQINIYEYSG